MLICLDLGHAGKPSRPDDRGAAANGHTEVSLCTPVVHTLDARLRERGHHVLLFPGGEYRDRWQRAHAWGADVYLQFHANAGGGDYASAYHDHRSSRGRALADWTAHELAGALPWAVHATEARPDTNGIPGDEGERPFACIGGCYPLRPVGLLLELGFIDRPAHVSYLLGNVGVVAEALARGIHTWGQGR